MTYRPNHVSHYTPERFSLLCTATIDVPIERRIILPNLCIVSLTHQCGPGTLLSSFLVWIPSLVVDSETSVFGHDTFSCVATRVAYPLTRDSSTGTSMSSRRCLSRVLPLGLGHWLNVHPIRTPGISRRTPSSVQSIGRFHLETDSHGMWACGLALNSARAKDYPLGTGLLCHILSNLHNVLSSAY